ncbi:hypothetical protein TIFTF001_014848 [Ficus carica]|uniref:Uncharacterized protein n=1 Tax=Ficus carica TaxID=3494 RepID=A0AA88A3G8_FICCA|nr:hypothetical protein TIFTF001_014848 [Ficus carica]
MEIGFFEIDVLGKLHADLFLLVLYSGGELEFSFLDLIMGLKKYGAYVVGLNSNNMLEGPSYLVSRNLLSSCEQESKWIYNPFRLIELSKSKSNSNSNSNLKNKRRLEDEEEITLRKSSKISEDAVDGGEGQRVVHDVSHARADQSNDQRRAGDNSDRSKDIHQVEDQSDESDRSSNQHQEEEEADDSDQPNDEHWAMEDSDQSNDQQQAGDYSDYSSLIHQLGRDISINCLLRLPRSDYGSIGSLNRSFRSLIRGGELYRLRRQMGIVEHWVYFSCNLLEWEAYDPNHKRWMHLPRMTSNDCFMCSDKESLAVGTELLVFGKEITSQVIYRYSILTNTWSSDLKMNEPRCLFGSASLREVAILAGGCDLSGNILSSAELYNSETGTWMTLPTMNKARKMCSGVFMDGKFYVIGGIGTGNPKMLTCGEVYDLETGVWTEIPDMFPARNAGAAAAGAPTATEAPPLVAVVNNTLYAADYAEKEVRKYEKERNEWITIGRLPERAVSMNGWGLAFRACGDRLIVIGGPRALGGGMIELNSWVPSEGPPQWDVLARRPSGSFVYNCTVMGC